MAHVEAPTFGSMLLAGVLLKLGGVGLLRLGPLVGTLEMVRLLGGYALTGLAFVTAVCCIQSDFKRLVAYRSVSHIMAIPILATFARTPSFYAVVLLMVFHGLSSPILFILVGVGYRVYSTRQLVFMRGLLLSSPLLSMLFILAFLFSLSAPPFPSFLSEVFFFMSAMAASGLIAAPFLFVFAVVSMVYSLLWAGSILFSSSAPSPTGVSVSYLTTFAIVIALVRCVGFLCLLTVVV